MYSILQKTSSTPTAAEENGATYGTKVSNFIETIYNLIDCYVKNI